VGDATVFQLTPPGSPGGSWTYKVLYNFGEDYNLNSPLILRNGNLYGTAAAIYTYSPDGNATGGIAFELQPPATPGGAWKHVHLHQFVAGQLPGGSLAMDKNGGIFGVTVAPSNQDPSGTVYLLATKHQP